MPRSETKQDIYNDIEVERKKLYDALTKLTEEQMELPGACEIWSVKDILSHLVDWEQRCLRWYRAGLKGEVLKTPDENYNWRQLPELNHEIYLKHKDFSLEDVQKHFRESFEEIKSAIDGMTDEALFTPGFYVWTRKSPLRNFIYANTSSHYRWASKLIRKFTRSLNSD